MLAILGIVVVLAISFAINKILGLFSLITAPAIIIVLAEKLWKRS